MCWGHSGGERGCRRNITGPDCSVTMRKNHHEIDSNCMSVQNKLYNVTYEWGVLTYFINIKFSYSQLNHWSLFEQPLHRHVPISVTIMPCSNENTSHIIHFPVISLFHFFKLVEACTSSFFAFFRGYTMAYTNQTRIAPICLSFMPNSISRRPNCGGSGDRSSGRPI